MIEYLNNYRKLLELKEINEKEIQENEILINDNYQKWLDTKDKEETVDLEIKTLNKKYDEIMKKKEKKLLSKIAVILILLAMIILLLFRTLLAFITSSSIYIMFFSIIKCTSIFKNQLKKDKNISNLLEQIETKEKELSDIKKLCDEYSQKIIKYRFISNKLNTKKIWINDSINELMRNYATPIFEEQLKNIVEKPKDNTYKKTKKKD